MGSLPVEPYYPSELLGDPVLFDWVVVKDLVWRAAKASFGLAQAIIFWLLIVQLDVVLFLANLVLPRRSTLLRPLHHGAPRPAAAFGTRLRGIRHVSRRRAEAASGNEVVPNSFSPLLPPSILHGPTTFLLCQLSFFVGATDVRGPEWLHYWSTWSGIGFKGDWGSTEWPGQWDLRSPCPALNALANHSLLPFDGRGIRPHQLASIVSHAFNLSPTLALALTWTAEPLWRHRGSFDLSDLCAHNVVESDASLLRPDVNSTEQKQDPRAQERAWPSLVDALLPTPESEVARVPKAPDWAARRRHRSKAESYAGSLSLANLAQAVAARRIQCARSNGQFSLTLQQKIYGSLKVALLHRLLRGSIGDLRSIVGGSREEQYLSGLEHIPAGWQPDSHSFFGVTFLQSLWRSVKVELAVGDTGCERQVFEEGQTGWDSPEDVYSGQPSFSGRD